MKDREWKPLFRTYLLPHLPGFDFKGSLVFVRPLEYLLRGFYFEASGFDRLAFYLTAFVQPLYAPYDHIHFSFGERLSTWGAGGWTVSPEDPARTMTDVLASIKRRGLPFINYVRTPHDLATKAPLVGGHPRSNPYAAEAVAFSHILCGQYPEAVQMLEHLEQMLREPRDFPTQPRETEMLNRCRSMHACLARDPREAIRQLDEWTARTRQSLRLPES
jgi:hypothetical protein